MNSSASQSINVSVLVPVYNRKECLPQLFAALAAQTLGRDRFEVIISDDGSEEPLRDLVQEFARQHGLRCVYTWQEHQGPGPARNAGLRLARGELIAFVDSDIVPEPTWLKAYLEAFTTKI